MKLVLEDLYHKERMRIKGLDNRNVSASKQECSPTVNSFNRGRSIPLSIPLFFYLLFHIELMFGMNNHQLLRLLMKEDLLKRSQ